MTGILWINIDTDDRILLLIMLMYNLIKAAKCDIFKVTLVTIPKTVPKEQKTYIFLRNLTFTRTFYEERKL